ncbi:hypothetical protein BMR1_01G02876 [Babesia microti strain RI]|uniref:MACPF domain-containing protein n=1 Tax=Babesia microti (strain RI) TaxID=1133968 RepID=A0A1N6LX32_BABMR|nr:hypothetical protein BMR1_01G02876 [Babesia microti strain RI]SIO73426.1 hypothetical protein BMR1_01G02876 [Babesia microti strain RI]|eukprot:XP_021337525.1 hypothetical protein BMR1_01G02876 [Babesia microti strain RI]
MTRRKFCILPLLAVCCLTRAKNVHKVAKNHRYHISDFLGAGYDVAMTQTDDSILPFKAPVLDVKWLSPGGRAPRPIGGWARPAESCSELIGDSEYSKENGTALSNRVKLDLSASVEQVGSGTLNLDYRGVGAHSNADSIKEFSKYITCSTYSSGLSTHFNWSKTHGFSKAVAELLSLKIGLKSELVPKLGLEAYRAAWTAFIEEFGTHVIKYVKMGGRIVSTIRVPASAEKSLQEHGLKLDVGVEASLKLGDLEVSVGTNVGLKKALEEFKNSCAINSTVWGGLLRDADLGGDLGAGDIRHWKSSLLSHAMPLEAVLEPLSNFMPASLEDDYRESLEGARAKGINSTAKDQRLRIYG